MPVRVAREPGTKTATHSAQTRWNGDDGSSPKPKAPGGLADLPPILRGWGSQQVMQAASPAESSEIRHRD